MIQNLFKSLHLFASSIAITLMLCGVTYVFKYTQNLEAYKYIQLYKTVQIDITALKRSKYDKELHKKLKSLKTKFTDRTTKNALSNFIQAYSSNNERLFKKRKTELHELLTANHKQLEGAIHKNSSVMLYIFGLGLALSLLALIVHHFFIQKNILQPIQKLTERIESFINGQYKFQFSQPKNNEIGRLESSFNSMADKVTNTIEDLKELDQAKTEFLNIVSHELRTPMTSIKGSLGLMASGNFGQLPDKVENLLHIAEEETNRLIRMTNDFLDLAKIEAKSQMINKEWILIDEVISKCVQALSALLQKAKVEVVWEESPEIEIFADTDRIQQVLTNLLGNAIKFSPVDSKIDIKAQSLQTELEIQIIDKGPGITSEDQEKIFEKFRQATGPTKPLVKGTGLGLFIAKALVEGHGGTIGIRSEVGVGSCFYFRLPDYREKQLSPMVEVAA